jgi:hypothetical protein
VSAATTSTQAPNERGDESPRRPWGSAGGIGQPRATDGRGTSRDPAAGFYGLVSGGTANSNDAAAAAWSASAHSLTAGDLERFDPAGANPGGENTELGQVLSAIAEEVHSHCAAVCAGIMAEFAANAAHARKTLPRNKVAGVVQALKQACKAALAMARQTAKAELQGRQRAATMRFRRVPLRAGTGGRRAWDCSPR